MQRLLALTVVVLVCGLALAQTTAPVVNGSFEEGAAENLVGWKIDCCDGATFTTRLVEAPVHDGTRALEVSKTNGRGFLLLHTAEPVPVKPDTYYESELFMRVVKREYGGKVYFVNEELDTEGKVIGVRYSPHHIWTPGYMPEGQWKRMWAGWKTGPKAAAVVLRFVVLGNPATLVFDDAALKADVPVRTHPAKVQSSEPPYDEAKALATLAARKVEPASVKMVGGQPQVVVGTKTYAPLIHNGSFWSPENTKFGGFGKAGLHLQTLAVQLGPQVAQNLIWDYPKEIEFGFVQKMLRKVASADPEAQVIMLVRVNLPRQWGLDHPDEVYTNEKSERVVADGHPKRIGTPEQPNEYWEPSYGSPAAREAVVGALRKLGEWVKTHEEGKMVAGWMICGGSDGQFFNNGWPGYALDHSPGQLQGYRLWLQEEYGTVEKLREAWGDPQVTFETATMPTEAERDSTGLFHGLKGPGRRIVDAVRFDNVAPTRAVRMFAKALKESVGRPTFAITYYPDAVYDGGSNKFAVTDLLAGDEIDGAVSVQEYGNWRSPGGTGGTTGSWGPYRLRGKLHIAEIDYRSYLSGMAGPIYDEEGLGATLTAEGFRAQVMRDIAAQCSRGMGAWFYDMGGIWYDDPPLWATITEARKMMEWSHRAEAPAPDAQVAVFVDEAAGCLVGKQNYDLLHRSTNAARLPLNLSGAQYDVHMLGDITNPKLRDYKVYMLLSSFSITKEQMAALKAKARRAGRTLVVVGPPGGASLDYPEPLKAFEELTGLKGTMLPAKTSLAAVRSGDDALLRDVPEMLVYGGTHADPLVVAEDPSATTLGTFVSGGKVADVVKRGRDGTVVYIAAPGGFTPELVRNIAMEAGVPTVGTAGQVTYAGCGVAAVHRIVPGEAAVRFAEKVDLIDPATGKVAEEGVKEWKVGGELWETGTVWWRKAGR